MTKFTTGAVVAAALALASLTGGDGVQAQQASAPNVDPRADALLRKMSTDLGQLQSFQFQAQHATELVRKDGEKIQLLARSNVAVQRPNELRADRIGSVTNQSLYYDGNAVTIYGAKTNLYATAKAPDNLDAAIDFARDQLGLEAPAGDLLYSNPYAALMEDVVSGTYVDEEPVGNRMCHHLAYRGHETDWQIWIEDGPRALPCRFVITSKNEPGAPEYIVTTADWRTAQLPAGTFQFQPPAGAARIPFASQRAQQPQTQQQPMMQRSNP